MPKIKKGEKVLYDFDYAEENEQKEKSKRKKAEKKKKSASKKHTKKVQADKKYDDEIIIGVSRIQEKPPQKKKVKEKVNPKESKKKSEVNNKNYIKHTIYNYDVDYFKEEELREKREKRYKKVKKVLKFLSGVVIFVGIICFALLSPIFNVQNIEVTGNSKLTKDEIISLSEITNNDNIFKVLSIKAENKISKNAYIDEVNVSKKLPSTIKISVKERKPKFLLQFGNGYVYISSQGYMLEISSKKLDLPIIIGCKTNEETYKTGNRLDEVDLEKLGTVIRIMDIAENNDIANLITSIDISDGSNYKIYLETEKKTAYLGDCSNLETRILYVKAMIKSEKDIEGEIFVNMNLNSEKAFFREKV